MDKEREHGSSERLPFKVTWSGFAAWDGSNMVGADLSQRSCNLLLMYRLPQHNILEQEVHEGFQGDLLSLHSAPKVHIDFDLLFFF